MGEQLPSEIRTTYILVVLFVLLLIVFFIVVVVVYNRRRVLMAKEKQVQAAEYKNTLLQKEIERQRSLQIERERISHDMHDDLGAGISALKLHAQFIKQQLPDQDPLLEDINLMIKTSDEMNHSMREMLWSLNAKNDNLEEFVHYVSNYGYDFFRPTGITFYVESDVDDNIQFEATARRHMFLCIKEAFHNIVKHSHARSVHFSIRCMDNKLEINIIDDGIGMQAVNSHGYGLESMTSRMKKLGGRFTHVPRQQGCHIQFSVDLEETV